LHYESHWLLAIAYAGFVLNLLNLIPVVPLDGGHVRGRDFTEDLDHRNSSFDRAVSVAAKTHC